MDKSSSAYSGQIGGPRRAHQPRGWRTQAIRIAAVSASLLLYYALPRFRSFQGGPSKLPNHDNVPSSVEQEFDWLKIHPQEQLAYHPCFQGLQCARVSVPINWNDPSNPARAALALVKVPAKVPVTEPRYGGAIVLNPGGPGNSGVLQVITKGRHIQAVADAPHSDLAPDGLSDGKYFDVIGFDPRGVNNTTPHIKCFPNRQAELNFELSKPSDFLFGISESYIDIAWAQYLALGHSCAIQHGDEPNMAAFANTAQVAEDIVAIIERHGQWREIEARSILDSRRGAKLSSLEREEALQRTRWQKNNEKLNYWGFSYGTILGQTFAVMHPDRVFRLIIDGVVDPDDYYSASWLKNLQDTDQIIFQWATYCNQAPGACPLAVRDFPEQVITARLARLADSLLTDPVPVPGNDEHGPMAVGYSDLMELLARALYNQNLPEMVFEIVRDLQERNGTRLAAWSAAGDLAPVSLSRDCLRDGLYSEACMRDQGAHGFKGAIACGDGPDLRNETKEDFREYFKELRGQSDVLGATWSGIRMLCSTWQTRPAWRVEGPWTANTSYPLLIIGNTYDPVTPLRNARRVSTLFPGSAVLHQNTEGHCSYAAPSLCSGKAIRSYFQDGTLPVANNLCEPEYRPWIGCVNPAGCSNRSAEDQALWEALSGMQNAY